MTPPCVLIVEDHEAARQATTKFFVDRGWNVQTARTATYAQWLLSAPFHGIIVDLTLPDGTAESILEAVEASRMRACVVVATQNEAESRLGDVSERFPRALLLPKPLDLEQVFAAFQDRAATRFG